MNDDIWTKDEVMAYLKVGLTKLKELRKVEGFPASILPTGHPRWRRADIIDWTAGKTDVRG